ncbi:MAG: acyl-CoA dehydrogenase [Betaproteobacteria bacterium]
MNFDRTEEQQLLAASIARFVERDYSFDKRRAILASPEGLSREVWETLAHMGLLGLSLPADHGGFDGGALDAMALMEAIGGALVVEPWLATVALAARLVARHGSDDQKRRLLPAVTAGRVLLAFAHAEDDARHALAHVATRAEERGGDYVLSGTKRAVANAAAADTLVVSARTSGGDTDAEGISLFLVERATPGLATRALRMLDGTRAADVVLDAVRVPLDARIGTPGGTLAPIEEVVDFATALLCAEAVGAIGSANEATLDYLRTRKQFGVPIGDFQALQHRMVDLAIELEQVKSMAHLACAAVDADADADALRRARTVSAAKVRVADACRRVSQESVQLHGAMGMSDELKVSHTFRRLTAIAQQFGDADHHLQRLARLARVSQ